MQLFPRTKSGIRQGTSVSFKFRYSRTTCEKYKKKTSFGIIIVYFFIKEIFIQSISAIIFVFYLQTEWTPKSKFIPFFHINPFLYYEILQQIDVGYGKYIIKVFS